jgi:hypothetical protein
VVISVAEIIAFYDARLRSLLASVDPCTPLRMHSFECCCNTRTIMTKTLTSSLRGINRPVSSMRVLVLIISMNYVAESLTQCLIVKIDIRHEKPHLLFSTANLGAHNVH